MLKFKVIINSLQEFESHQTINNPVSYNNVHFKNFAIKQLGNVFHNCIFEKLTVTEGLYDGKFSNSTFTQGSLQGLTISNTGLISTHMRDLSLSNTVFKQKTSLIDVTFDKTDLDTTTFKDIKVNDLTFKDVINISLLNVTPLCEIGQVTVIGTDPKSRADSDILANKIDEAREQQKESIDEASSLILKMSTTNVTTSDTSATSSTQHSSKSLLQAFRDNNSGEIPRLLSLTSDVNYGDTPESNRPHGRSTLHWACVHQNDDLLRLLLQQPTIDLTLEDEQNNTALIYLINTIFTIGHTEEQLLKLGGMVKLLMNHTDAPIFYSLKNSHGQYYINLIDQHTLFSTKVKYTLQDAMLRISLLESNLAQSVIERPYKNSYQAIQQLHSSSFQIYSDILDNINITREQADTTVDNLLKRFCITNTNNYEPFKYLAHMLDKGGVVTTISKQFIAKDIIDPNTNERWAVVIPKDSSVSGVPQAMLGTSFEGWNAIDFLAARCRIYLYLFLNLHCFKDKLFPNEDVQSQFLLLLKKEIILLTLAYKIAEINNFLAHLPNIPVNTNDVVDYNKVKDVLGTLYYYSLCNKCTQLEINDSFYYPTGNTHHTVYVNLEKRNHTIKGNITEIVLIRVDNIGEMLEDNVYKHISETDPATEQKRYKPFYLRYFPPSNFHVGTSDCKELLEKHSTASSNPGRKGLLMVYNSASKRTVMQEFNDLSYYENHMKSGHCVLRNHNVGIRHRFFSSRTKIFGKELLNTLYQQEQQLVVTHTRK